MIEEGARLGDSVSIAEDGAGWLAPDFQEAGFTRPARVALIENGGWREALVSPRSALEYGVATNGASAAEAPLAVDVAPGELAREEILARLDTGVPLGNLWYLNYSDRSVAA